MSLTWGFWSLMMCIWTCSIAQRIDQEPILSPRPARVRDRDMKPDEPTCDQLKAMWRVETLGPCAPVLYNYLAKQQIDISRDQRAGSFLAQRISLAIQRGNAASNIGTMPQEPHF